MAIKIWKKYSQTQQSDVEDRVTALVRGLLKKSVKEKNAKITVHYSKGGVDAALVNLAGCGYQNQIMSCFTRAVTVPPCLL